MEGLTFSNRDGRVANIYIGDVGTKENKKEVIMSMGYNELNQCEPWVLPTELFHSIVVLVRKSDVLPSIPISTSLVYNATFGNKPFFYVEDWTLKDND